MTLHQVDQVLQTLKEIVNHPELAVCFDGSHTVLNEQTIVQKQGRVLKPDRVVFLENKEAFLLDYKTGMHQAKYEKQLEEYKMALEEMGFEVMKKTLVYIGETLNVIHL